MNAKKLGKVKVGDLIPDFEAQTEDGKTITSTSLIGHKTIMYFYPKDDTPGCTKEACNLRDNYSYFMSKGYKIIGVSKDSIARHQKFIEKYSLPFPLIADTDLNVLNAFGFYGPKKFMGRESLGTYRTTVVFDEKGLITHIIYDVKSADHSDQLKEAIGL
jgi:peroxiredoxin Q/BCP